MIQVKIIMTGKSYNSKDKYSMFADELKNFRDLTEAKNWLKKTYGNSKRSKMYIDCNNKSKHIGYVIGFHNADYSHSPVERWLQRDWIEFRNVESLKLS